MSVCSNSLTRILFKRKLYPHGVQQLPKIYVMIFSTLTKHITPPTSTKSRDLIVEKRRDPFMINRKLKMKQAQSLIQMKNEHNKKLNELVTAQNSDTEVPYLSLLNSEYALENIFNTEGNTLNELLLVSLFAIELTLLSL